MFAKFTDRLLTLVAAHVAKTVGIDAIAKNIAGHINIPHMAEVVCDTLDLSEIEDEIAKRVSVTASDVAEHIETKDVADSLDCDDIADKVAGYIDLDYDKVCAAIDLDYSEIASNLDLSDLAREIDTSSMEFDYSEIVSNLCMSTLSNEFDVSDIAAEIDYEKLAKALLSQFAKAKAVEVRPAGN